LLLLLFFNDEKAKAAQSVYWLGYRLD
jgi:hypothetical protein